MALNDNALIHVVEMRGIYVDVISTVYSLRFLLSRAHSSVDVDRADCKRTNREGDFGIRYLILNFIWVIDLCIVSWVSVRVCIFPFSLSFVAVALYLIILADIYWFDLIRVWYLSLWGNFMIACPGGLLYILHVLCTNPTGADPADRLAAAELLAKLQADKLTGPRWTRYFDSYRFIDFYSLGFEV